MGTRVVVVESPTKAQTIEKYLGSNYVVLASYGHVRDLQSKDGSVVPEKNFAMKWQVSPTGSKRLGLIKNAVKDAEAVILATDPDREGEAISWHVLQSLKGDHGLKGKRIERVVFNEITKQAVTDAFGNPRSLDVNLVDAYLARRTLDYLVGFTLSPVLWRKLPGAKSAGRVQSVVLRLICERESEIESFVKEEFWNIYIPFSQKDVEFTARLTHLDNVALKKFSLSTKAQAVAIKDRLAIDTFVVQNVVKQQEKRAPYPPFTTSTMQQEASKTLHYSPGRTMRIAQKLYEGIRLDGTVTGIITYMRTDGIALSKGAVSSIRKQIARVYGNAYLPSTPRQYKKTIKNAQEAHEAIRPTAIERTPQSLKPFLQPEELALYDLIWKRTMASQMANAQLERTTVDIQNQKGSAVLRATGIVTKFQGFLHLYQAGQQNAENDQQDDKKILPPLQKGEVLSRDGAVEAKQSFTAPPRRYSEASLIKTMEELGIGRPSTYTAILKVLQERDYTALRKRHFVPSDKGRVLTAFLCAYFNSYFNYDFTSVIEERLDTIAAGDKQWKSVLNDFWHPFSQLTNSISQTQTQDIRQKINENLEGHFFKTEESRQCPICKDGRTVLNFGKYGMYVSCSAYPVCKYSRPLENTDKQIHIAYPKIMGKIEKRSLSLKNGPYGIYLELEADGKAKPKRMALPKSDDPQTLSFERARQIISLPRKIGVYPQSGEDVTASIGRFGAFLKWKNTFFSVPPKDDVVSIKLDRAVEIIENARKKHQPQVVLGKYPDTDKDISLHKGRYGPYVQCGAMRASLTKGIEVQAVTLEMAIEILQTKKKTIKKKNYKKPRFKIKSRSASQKPTQ